MKYFKRKGKPKISNITDVLIMQDIIVCHTEPAILSTSSIS